MAQNSESALSRRSFLKTALAGAGAAALPTIIVPGKVHAFQKGQRIHPNISPLKVVGLRDEKMTTDRRLRVGWNKQEEAVNSKAVATNIDRLATTLAGESNVRKAWETIFVKPPGKAWNDVVVAIKTNNIAQQHTRSAVMAKICHVLTDVLGVKGQHIHIYDAKHGGSISRGTPFKGLPDGVEIENTWGGMRSQAPVPAPWKSGSKSSQCVTALAEGKADILIDIAMCKGHGGRFGGFTMCCKNHFGSFSPRPGHAGDGTDYLLSINKSEAILGKQNARGRVEFPRQQLCIVDALWASRPGPSGHPTAQPNALFMGVCGPVVDYQIATKFRKEAMGWPVNQTVADRFLSDFGFTPDKLPSGGKIITP
ncbi:MAG: DUF362 domain-containing protein, partial [Planctomycetes bacterium]|nr:DUF362 domain-containing protein [Planctomycetota bacterium]